MHILSCLSLISPGTGKTTTARKIGQFYYELGFLSKAEVIECSATNLVGEYVGHTGPKTKKQLEQGLGKVLFIDEAYRLGQGHFTQEAIDELVDCVTKPKFHGKMVIILAGYDRDMNSLLSTNEGLSSRFANEIIFPSLLPHHCLELLEATLSKEDIFYDLHDAKGQLGEIITELSKLPSWGNARDVQTLAKSMIGAAYQDETTEILSLTNDTALLCANNMLLERTGRAKIFKGIPREIPPMQLNYKQSAPNNPDVKLEVTTQIQESAESMVDNGRDDGVPDAVWQQLEEDKNNAELRAKEAKENRIKQEEELLAVQKAAKEAEDTMRQYQECEEHISDETKQMELMRLRELARIREANLKAEQGRRAREIENARKAEVEKKQKEQLVQEKLKEMGVCCAGFRWIKQSNGYRCAGGSHFVSNAQIGLL